MSIRTRPGEEHLAYAPERHDDRPEPAAWPKWDEVDAQEDE